MGFENLFFKKENTTQPKGEEDESDLAGEGMNRRSFLRGMGAFAAASAIPMQEAFGQFNTIEPIVTLEDKELNVLRIRAHEKHLKEYQYELARPGVKKQQILNMLYGENGVPPSDQSVLEGTELDRREFFEMNGSWPAVQVRTEAGDPEIKLRFGHNLPPVSDKDLVRNGNSFFVDNVLVSTKHTIGKVMPCETIDHTRDIAGCSVDDLDVDETFKENAARVKFSWDRAKALEDIHGKFAHIPSFVRKRENSREDDTMITSGHIFKITPSFLYDPDIGVITFFSEENSKISGDILKGSYGMIVPSKDTNLDGFVDMNDINGISGSPVFTDEDCAAGRRIPSGIQWGSTTITDVKKKITYTVILFHGPEIVGEMIDKVNTILSKDMDESDISSEAKRALSIKVQQALVDYGYRNLGVDGVYGDDTEAVIKAFQEREFSEATRASSIIPGVLDRMTWNALFPNEQDPDKEVLWGTA